MKRRRQLVAAVKRNVAPCHILACITSSDTFKYVNMLLGRIGYQQLEILDMLPKFKGTRSKRIDGVKRVMYIMQTGVFYCLTVLPSTNLFQGGFGVGPNVSQEQNHDFLFHHQTRNALTEDDIFYLAYNMQQDHEAWKQNDFLFDKGYKSLYGADDDWKEQLTRHALTHMQNNYSSIFLGDPEQYFYYHASPHMTYFENVTVKLVDKSQKTIACIAGMSDKISLLALLTAIYDRALLHRLANQEEVHNICAMIQGMLCGRLRFIASVRTKMFQRHEESFGHIVSCDIDYKWTDPDNLVAEHIWLEPIRQIVWQYVHNKNLHLQRLEQTILDYQKHESIISLCPAIHMVDFDQNFQVKSYDYSLNIETTPNLNDKFVATHFVPAAQSDLAPVLQLFLPAVVDYNTWKYLPRKITFVHPWNVWPLRTHRSDMSLSEILLLPTATTNMSAIIDHKHKLLTHPHLTTNILMKTIRCKMWHIPPPLELIEKFQTQHKQVLKGICDERKMLAFLLQECQFIDENHYSCIRNIRYMHFDDLACSQCPLQARATTYQYGLSPAILVCESLLSFLST